MTPQEPPSHARSPVAAPRTPLGGLGKAYTPHQSEPDVLKRWNQSGAFHADPSRVLSGEREAFCILIPPPNVTGALHLGHALNNTLQDILTRSRRMYRTQDGSPKFEALWMPGTDHAGIATQAVVEKRLRSQGALTGPLKEPDRNGGWTREKFVDRVMVWKNEYEARITEQLKAMGCSCDFSRQRFTMDDVCARAVREAFFILFRDGLIYRGKRLVNWDPALQTAVADDECYEEEVDAAFYYLRYPLVSGEPAHRAGSLSPVTWGHLATLNYPTSTDHPPTQQAWITVATTRPETYLGDTAVAISQHDPRAPMLRGMSVQLPLVNRVIPIIEDTSGYVVLPRHYARTEEEAADPKAQFATGFLKVTPAHDNNDYQLGELYKDQIAKNSSGQVLINILSPDGKLSDQHGWQDTGNAKRFVGMQVMQTHDAISAPSEARRAVVDALKQHEIAKPEGTNKSIFAFEKQQKYAQTLKFSDRSKAVIEPYLSDQWFMRVTDDRMAGSANRALVTDQCSGGAGVSPASESLASGGTGVSPASESLASGGAGVSPVSATDTSIPPPQGLGRDFPVTQNFQISLRRLPHFQRGGATYFVTFRVLKGELTPAERQIVLDACLHFHDQRMYVSAAVVMPDHVHLLLTPFPKSDTEWFGLGELMHSIKSFTSHTILKARGTPGPLWQDEHFDRIIRSDDDFAEKLGYMKNNPAKAGLVAPNEHYPFFAWNPGRLNHPSSESEGGRDARPTQDTSPAPSAPTDHQLRFHPPRYAKTFEQWHNNIRDWCISRQLWWGHRIPIFYVASSGTYRPSDHASPSEQMFNQMKGELSELLKQGGLDPDEVHVRDDHVLIQLPWPEKDGTFRWVNAFAMCCRSNRAVAHLTSVSNYRGNNVRAIFQDPDVLDTWFSSALWPLSTLGWPDPAQSPQTKDLLQAFNPTSVLSTAREIITLWVSRMTMMNRYLLPVDHPQSSKAQGPQPLGSGSGPVPFRNVFIHAVVQDGDGKRMSKSAGNGVDPLDIIDSHGADALRFTLCQMTTSTQDVRMPVKLLCPHCKHVFAAEPKLALTPHEKGIIDQACPKCAKAMCTSLGVNNNLVTPTDDKPEAANTSEKFDLGRNLCNKLWNASRFTLSIFDRIKSSASTPIHPASLQHPATPTLLIDRWMLSRLATATRDAAGAIEHFEFSDYAETIYKLLWWDFCDWYLEAIKPTVDSNPEQQAVLAHALETILRLLHPIAPFITETIFEHVRDLQTAPIAGIALDAPVTDHLLCTAGWPRIDESLINPGAEREFEQFRELISVIRNVRSEHQVLPKRRITLHAPSCVYAQLMAAPGLVETLAGIESVVNLATTPALPPAAVKFRAMGDELAISNLVDAAVAADAGAETDRLKKLLETLTKSETALAGRLNNPGYVDKAPPKLVEESRAQLAKIQGEIEATRSRLKEIAAS